MSETAIEPESETAAAMAEIDAPIDVRGLIAAGVHFGHQTRRWNPKMRRYIYGARAGIHIIDLDQTLTLFQRACDFVSSAVARGGHILFVGTKRQAQEIIQEEARRSEMYFVTNRWLGGTLTNFRTIKGGLERLRTLERMKEEGTYVQLPKKEVVRLERERERLEKFIGGIKGMGALPAAVFVVDPQLELIAIEEARKLSIPLVALTDTNCNPDVIDYVIPGNDDAIRSISLITKHIADACIAGKLRRRQSDEQPRDGGAGGDRRAERMADVAVTRYRGARN
ncbi:MAG: 30S ribosomal protein S2 [Myxococcales bacterium]|nr:30S ribosomal protein S2 [Myxococcales bacterium]